MRKVLKTILIIAVLTGLLTTVACAEACSVSVTPKDVSTNTAIPGSTFMLYRVAELKDNSYVYTETFAEYDQPIYDVSELDAQKLYEYAEDNKAEGTLALADKSGTANFTDLEAGVYLIVQTAGDSCYYNVNPFVVNLPMTSSNGKTLLYHVDAAPKAEKKDTDPGDDNPDKKIPQTGQLNWPVPVAAAVGILMFSIGFVLYKRGRENE